MKVRLINYYYGCGDGCCTDYGVELYVDGEYIEKFPEEDDALRYVIEEYTDIEIEDEYQ